MDFKYGGISEISHTHAPLFCSISLAFLSIPRNATSFFFSLFRTLISGLSLSILIFLFNLSISLFLLSLNPQRLWVFQWVSIHFFVGLLGFHLISLCILFHSIFNDLFWVCLYFLFLLSFVGL